jgi:Family of unknown function (DUF6093)
VSLRPGEISAGRVLAESLMVDTIQISRPGAPIFDPSDGSYDGSSTIVYDGQCRVRTPNLTEQLSIFGQGPVTTSRYVIWVPWSAPEALVGDVATVTLTEDPILAGRKLRIVVVPAATFVMVRKLGAEVIV